MKEEYITLDYRDGKINTYILNQRVVKYPSGDFERTFKWNVPELTKNAGHGYGYGLLVQHIIRKTVSTSSDINTKYGSDEDFNSDYWEAWEVKKNTVILPDNPHSYDDCWRTPIPVMWRMIDLTDEKKAYHYIGNAQERKNSNGITFIAGHVYWAPLGSTLQKIVMNTFAVGTVKQAGDLLSAWKVEGYEEFDIVFSHRFVHSWEIGNPTDWTRFGLPEKP